MRVECRVCMLTSIKYKCICTLTFYCMDWYMANRLQPWSCNVLLFSICTVEAGQSASTEWQNGSVDLLACIWLHRLACTIICNYYVTNQALHSQSVRVTVWFSSYLWALTGLWVDSPDITVVVVYLPLPVFTQCLMRVSCLASDIDVVMTMLFATEVTWALSCSSCHWYLGQRYTYSVYAAGDSGCIGNQLWLKINLG